MNFIELLRHYRSKIKNKIKGREVRKKIKEREIGGAVITLESKDRSENLIGYNLLKVGKRKVLGENYLGELIIATEGSGNFNRNRCQGNAFGNSVHGPRFRTLSNYRGG